MIYYAPDYSIILQSPQWSVSRSWQVIWNLQATSTHATYCLTVCSRRPWITRSLSSRTESTCGHVAERDGSAARKILLLFIFVNTDQGYLMSSNGVSDASKSTVSKSCGCTSSSNLSSCIRIYDDDDEQKKMNSEKDITQQRSLPGCRFVKRVKV